jgi:hypothetical protein
LLEEDCLAMAALMVSVIFAADGAPVAGSVNWEFSRYLPFKKKVGVACCCLVFPNSAKSALMASLTLLLK